MAAQQLTDLFAVRDAFNALAADIGPKCKAYPSINLGSYEKHAAHCSFYVNGLGDRNGSSFVAKGNTWEEVLADARQLWAERSDQHAINITKSMALAIIRLTMEHGECTDAALRAEFDAADLTRFGEQACTMANDMAERGPFSIVTLAGANDQAEAA